jgi:succinoglycan biosynthesis transport protein ExoP
MAAKSFKRFLTLQDILQFLSRYVKYWRLGICSALLGGVLALAYFVYGKPSYYSKSSVEWTYVDLPIKSEISDVRGNTRWDNIYSQVINGLQSRWLIERTAMRLGLVSDVSELGSIWNRFINKVKITSSVGSHLEIEVWVYEPRLAKLWPEAMLLEYHDYLTEARIKHRDVLVKGFTKEMDRIRENLKAETERDRRFESDNQILENFVANNKLEQLPTQMLTYRSQIDAMDEMEKFIEATALSSAEKLSLLRKYRSNPLPVGTIVRRNEQADPFIVKNAPNSVVSGATGESENTVGPKPSLSGRQSGTTIVLPEASQRAEAWEGFEISLREAEREYQRLSATLLPGHEKMREIKKQIDNLNFALDADWKKEIAAFQLEKQHIRQRFEDLQDQMPEYRKLVAGYDDYRRDFRLQSSGRLAWEQAYITMKSRIAAMDYTGPEVQVDFHFKGFTDVRDDIPVSPNKQKLLTYALALSLGLGLGLPVLTERLRFTSSFVGEAEKYCQYPACGIVPMMEIEDRPVLKQLKDGGSAEAHIITHAKESFRIIRSSLPFYAPADNKKQVIMVTSARPNDGKSTVAAHLAKSFADAGENVLLIDGDLRRGGLHNLFNLDRRHPGMVEILSQGLKWEDFIQPTGITNLWFLSRGNDSKGVDLLSRNQFKNLIEKMRLSFDRIIVDTPPLLGIADSLLISKAVDGLIFVIRADQTAQRDVATASEILHHSGAQVYGFVLNCVNLKNLENYYYYGSYYSRYYEPTYYSNPKTGNVA